MTLSPRPIAAGACVILVLTVVAYAPSYQNGFVWDDDDYVTSNTTLRDVDGLRRIWLEPGAVPQYYPLTHTTFWIEWQLWGDRATGYHIINALLHAANAILVWRLLRRLKLPGAGAFVAGAIFAVHPMMVESVAWITERKNVLSGLLFLLSLHVYLRYHVVRTRRAYFWALGLFVAALLSKTATATLPAVVLVILWWKHGRIQRRDVAPLLPFFAAAIGLGLNTVWMEQHVVGAVGDRFAMSFAERLLVAGRVPWSYLYTLLWPGELIFIYPRWSIDTGSPVQWLFPAASLGLLVALAMTRRRGLLAAALIFGGMLFPAMGFFNVYPMRFSYVADHFCYLPAIAIIGLVATALARVRVAAVIVVAICAVLTFQQTRVYRGQEALWRHTVDHNPTAAIARVNYGIALSQAGRYDAAVEQLSKGYELEPTNPEVLNGLGSAYRKLGRDGQAQQMYEQALAKFPRYAIVRVNLAFLHYERNRDDPQVREHIQQALRDKHPNRYPEAHFLMALVLAHEGADAAAVKQYEQALVIREDYVDAHYELGLALARLKQYDRAAVHLHRTLELKPDHTRAKRFLNLLERPPSP